MNVLGSIIAVATGWFGWQILLVAGFSVQEDNGPFGLQILLSWFSLPIGIAIAVLFSSAWFKLVPLDTNDESSPNSMLPGALVCIAALTSCGWFAASTDENPPKILFYPLVSYLSSN
ncbi:MAG: hypothetical protein HEP70_19315 [Rhodobiaceae bacterium]|jgi:hypothetical protein|nr:hypothetical protein [Rhodobiaceae bacterium]